MSSMPEARKFVRNLYNNLAWHVRVENMSDDQVLAIYFRVQQKKEKESAPQHPSTDYYCPVCGMHFTYDNPDLTECIYCTTELIRGDDIHACK
jgi:hypothetical protein